jgi:hypothetical protein
MWRLMLVEVFEGKAYIRESNTEYGYSTFGDISNGWQNFSEIIEEKFEGKNLKVIIEVLEDDAK